MPIVYSVVDSSVLFIAPNVSAARLACSMYCSILIISSIAEIPSLLPNWLRLVSMCVILVSSLALSPDHILSMICVRHMGE